MDEFKETGGVSIGMLHTSKPFAVLTVNKYKLEINASIFGNLAFKPTDIVSISTTSMGITSGIRIEHSVNNYPKNIRFTSFNKSGLIQNIVETGFLTNRSPIPVDIDNEITELQRSGRFPIKTPAAIILVVIWNVLCLRGFYPSFIGDQKNAHDNWWAQSAFGFFILTAVLLLVSERFRKLVLKPGRKVRDISRFLYFIILLCSILFIGFCFMSALTQQH